MKVFMNLKKNLSLFALGLVALLSLSGCTDQRDQDIEYLKIVNDLWSEKIMELQSKVHNLESTIESLTSTVDDLDSKIDDIESDMILIKK